MKELIKFIAQALVDHPDEVVVKEIEGEQTSVRRDQRPRKPFPLRKRMKAHRKKMDLLREKALERRKKLKKIIERRMKTRERVKEKWERIRQDKSKEKLVQNREKVKKVS